MNNKTKKSIELEISSELFRQLVEHSKSVTPNAIFQSIKTVNGRTTYRVLVFDDKFEELMDYCEQSSKFVPLNFEGFDGKQKGIGQFKDLNVKFMTPLKYYGIYGVSFIYRMICQTEGHLLFWITEKNLGIIEGDEAVINGKVKKEIDYHKGGKINQIYYTRIKK